MSNTTEGFLNNFRYSNQYFRKDIYSKKLVNLVNYFSVRLKQGSDSKRTRQMMEILETPIFRRIIELRDRGSNILIVPLYHTRVTSG